MKKSKKIIKTCEQCGKDFYTYLSCRKKCCSRKCGDKSRITMVKKICLQCGKKFEVNPSNIKRGGGKYCSKRCAGLAKKTRVRQECIQCGKHFKIWPSRTKKAKVKFCSSKCYGQWQSKNRKREKGANWKGGISSFATTVRISSKYREWRQLCFIRDDFTCYNCGQIGGELQVHHIKPFSVLLQEAIKYMPLLSPFEAAISYTPLWDINNGITLCAKCHNKLQKKTLQKIRGKK